MNELFDTTHTETKAAPGGRILIVDDDPIVAGMLGVSLSAAGHEILEANSGEEALARLAESRNAGTLPDLVILDIEMPDGMDSYETCRKLRVADANLPVIFLSGHDELDDRLRAYDAGGDDFMAKPFMPDEVLRKAGLAIEHKRRREAASEDKRTSFDTAMMALTSLGESGVTLKFSRSALGCRTQHALATLTIEAMGAFGINCHVQLRAPTETLTWTQHGPASPLEESVIDKSRLMDRIFSFRNRLIINYDTVSLLVTNMPIENDDLCGRIRDHAAMIIEATELAVDNINLRTEAIMRSDELHQLAIASRKAVEDLRKDYRDLQIATRLELNSMANTIEDMYIHLGLSDSQELTVSNTVRASTDRVLALFDRSSDLDKNFAGIVEELTKVGEHTVKQESETAPEVELW